jgi:putative membrane protein
MKKPIFTILFAATVMVGAAQNDNSTSNKKADNKGNNKATTATEKKDMKKDQKWVEEVAKANMMEIKMSETALEMGTAQEVKDLAQMMITDHQKAGEELKAVASKKGITLAESLDEKDKKECEKIKEKKGGDFDRAYADAMVKDHKKVVAMFKKESEKGEDADLKSWATTMLPKLEHHLQMSQDLEKKLKGDNKDNKKETKSGASK